MGGSETSNTDNQSQGNVNKMPTSSWDTKGLSGNYSILTVQAVECSDILLLKIITIFTFNSVLASLFYFYF